MVILQVGNPTNTLFCSFFFSRAEFLIEADNVRTKDVAFAFCILPILQYRASCSSFHGKSPLWGVQAVPGRSWRTEGTQGA